VSPLWQVNTRGRKVLEMTDAELLASYKAGKLTSKTLVWSEGMGEWAPLGDVPRIATIIRADSEPPASGTRPVEDEDLRAGSKTYSSAGSEPPTSPGTNPNALAVYERAIATIEFPDSDDPPESSDEPTPAFGIPASGAVDTPLPKLATAEPIPGRTTLVDGVFDAAPPLPPLPSRSLSAFPAPVSSSPLGAALSSTVSPMPTPPSAHSDGYALAKATPLPGTLPVAKDRPSSPKASPSPKLASSPATPLIGRSAAAHALSPQPKPSAHPAPRLVTPLPTAATSAPTPHTPFVAPRPPPPLPAAGKAAADDTDEAPASQKVMFSPARPAIEFLPPIIVQEKEDDGATVIELPLEAQVGFEPQQQPLDANIPLDAGFHESTLVLAGRRPKRWVPLGAAVAIAVGAACLASALTAVIVGTRPAPAPRIIEKRVLVPAPPPVVETPAPAPAPPAAEPAAEASPARAATKDGRPSVDRSVSKASDSSSAPKPTWKREDPGTLEAPPAAPTHRSERAGFPTNPGF